MEWKNRAHAKLQSLADIVSTGTCIAPSDLAIRRAGKTLNELIELQIKPNRIGPVADGGVFFLFKKGRKVARVVAENEGEYYLVTNDRFRHQIEVYESDVIGNLCDFLQLV
jgi:hypothetical protein